MDPLNFRKTPRALPWLCFVSLMGIPTAWAAPDTHGPDKAPVAAPPDARNRDGVTAPPSSPQPSAVARAERAFNDAVQRMDAGEYEHACPLLEESQSLDPSSGTLLNLGDCYEHLGRSASAWRAFSEARATAAASGRPDRAQVADARVNRLAPTLRRLVVLPPRRPLTDLVIQLDDRPLHAAASNEPIPVDPGVHRLRATAAGMREYAAEVSAPDVGTTTALQLPELQPAAPALERTGVVAPDRTSDGLDGQQIGAVAGAVVGVAGLATGTIFGLQSLAKHDDSDGYCSGSRCSDARGVALMDEARRAGNVATLGFVLGGVGLGAAAVLWFARPFGDAPGLRLRAGVGLAPGALELRGSW